MLYYSDFDINTNDWLTDYNQINELKSFILKVLGVDWLISFKANCRIRTAFSPVNTPYKDPLDIISQCFFLETNSTTTIEQFIHIVTNCIKANYYEVLNSIQLIQQIEEYYNVATKSNGVIRAQESEEHKYTKIEGIGRCQQFKSLLPNFSQLKSRIITPMIAASERVVEYIIPHAQCVQNVYNKIASNLPFSRTAKKKCIELIKIPCTLSGNAMEKLSNYVDNLVKSKKILYHKVIQDMAVVILHISKSSLNDAESLGDYKVYKPASELYGLLMKIMFYYGLNNSVNSHVATLVAFAKCKLKCLWRDELAKPCEKFYDIAQKDIKQQLDKEDSIEEPSIMQAFDATKFKMLQMWNHQIIEKTINFKSYRV